MLEGRERERALGLYRAERSSALAHDAAIEEVASRVTSQTAVRDATARQWVRVAPLPVSGICQETFDRTNIACLRGRVTRYNIRTERVSIGRSTPQFQADVNLALEGPALKISRKQAMLERRADGSWWLECCGQRSVVVNGRTLLPGEVTRMSDGAVLEIAVIRLVFRCAPTNPHNVIAARSQ